MENLVFLGPQEPLPGLYAASLVLGHALLAELIHRSLFLLPRRSGAMTTQAFYPQECDTYGHAAGGVGRKLGGPEPLEMIS